MARRGAHECGENGLTLMPMVIPMRLMVMMVMSRFVWRLDGIMFQRDRGDDRRVRHDRGFGKLFYENIH